MEKIGLDHNTLKNMDNNPTMICIQSYNKGTDLKIIISKKVR